MLLARLNRTAESLGRQPFLRRLILAFILGAAATFAMPPWHLVPVLWVSLPAFLILTDSCRTTRGAALVGWAFGFGHFTVGFAWIVNAFYVDRDTFGALAVPAIGGLAAGFGLYTALVAVAVHRVPALPDDAVPSDQWRRLTAQVLALAAAWTFIEWMRGWFLTGLPWNPIGSVWTGTAWVLQGASLIGVTGLTFLTVLAAAAPYILCAVSAPRRQGLLTLVPQLPLLALAAFGFFRLGSAVPDTVPGVMLRLVQPNIAQADKWRPGERERHVIDQVAMSRRDADGITHVIWAETAVPFPLNRADGARRAAAEAAPENGLLLTGAPRLEDGDGTRQVYNSLFALDRSANMSAAFDKFHLVPFGEYTPFAGLIPIPQLTGGSGFSAGPGPMTLTVDGLPPFSPLICYEVIFSRAVTGAERPDWLLNITNDAWFGDTSGPRQHFAAARLRAVEEGLPLVRVANTGISAVIDSYGRPLSRLDIGQKGVLDSPLPVALPPTVFSRIGNSLALVFALLAAAGAAALTVRHLPENRVTH